MKWFVRQVASLGDCVMCNSSIPRQKRKSPAQSVKIEAVIDTSSTVPSIEHPLINTISSVPSSTTEEVVIETLISVPSLPDETVIEILSRLPAQSVLVSKTVCSSWYRLTSTIQFAQMHFKRASPQILGRFSSKSNPSVKGWYMIHDSESSAKFVEVNVKGLSLIKDDSTPASIITSCNGLLLFRAHANRHVIYNVATGEDIAFRLRETDIVCGFYFHALEREYKLLIYHKNDANKYSVYGLSTKQTRTLAISRDDLISRVPDAATNCALFWLADIQMNYNGITVDNDNALIMFNVRAETFAIKPQPTNTYQRGMKAVKLLENDEKLWYCRIYGFYARTVQVWILDDTETWKWVKKYTVNFDPNIKYYGDNNTTLVLGVQNGNLLVCCNDFHLLWYNLRTKTLSEIDTNYAECVYTYAMQFIHSLVPLQNSNIQPAPETFNT